MNYDAHELRPEITESLVRQLVAAQFPQWANLPVTRVVPGGWDNRTFRLGDDMLVRLPIEEAVESLNASVAGSILLYHLYRESARNDPHRGVS